MDLRRRFTSVYEANYPAVLRYARRQLPEHAAFEVVDETFTAAWRRIADLPEPALPWLLGVAHNMISNQRRGDARRWRLTQRQAAEPWCGLEPDPADEVAERDHVRTALQSLTTSDRELLILVAWDGLDIASTAEVLGLSPATTAVRLHRARRRLEAALKELPENVAAITVISDTSVIPIKETR